ncbi:HDIG domain-containing protein [Candidatus Bathyarchaeota archaeon]|nr:HDIG domain-containing protein [Candidatus Bathyarchaeota archaeon]
MSNKLPSREQAIEILRKNQCSTRVINHCQAVAALAVELAKQLETKNCKVDLELVEIGALLHDLGRSKTHTVDHAIVGAKIAESLELPQPVISIIKRHVGAGITAQEAQWLGWPKDVYVPATLEEKIVSYADKLIDGSRKVPIDLTIKQLQMDQKSDAAERVRKLHEEITSLLRYEL